MIKKTIALLALLALPWAANADFDNYAPSSLAKVLAERTPQQDVDYDLDAESPGYRTVVRAVGSERAIAPATLQHVRYWAKMQGHGPEVVDMFKHEVLVREQKKEYWLPIQESLLPAWRDEVKPEDEVEILSVWIGWAKKTPVFLIGQFTAL
jgi:hypothetical protein